MNILQTVVDLLQQSGTRLYGGEAVNQLDHALQCALLAEAESSSDELVAAALLHDLGHMLHDLGDDAVQQSINDRHEIRALHLLRSAFGNAVLEPIRLHVNAKRYLCRVDVMYYDALSPASKASLALQGGAYSAEEARRFIALPYARDAARLRTWDDRAKIPGAATPPLAHYAERMQRCAM